MADWEDLPDYNGTDGASQPRSPWQLFKDSFLGGALHNPIGAEGVVRATSKLSAEELNKRERALSDKLAAKDAADAEATKGWETLSPENIGYQAVKLLGGAVGGIDPTAVIAPGRHFATRILSQMGINAGLDLGGQLTEKKRGVRDEVDPREIAFNAGAGLLTQGAFEVHSKAQTGRMINRGSKYPQYAALNDVIVNHLEGGGTLEHPKTSPKGAMGPQQVMPETARKPGFDIKPWNGKTQADLARVGRQYSAALLDHYKGDSEKALAAYNGGFGRVDHLVSKYGDSWLQHMPEESRNYVKNGLDKMNPEVRSGQPIMEDFNFDPSDNVHQFPSEKLAELTPDELRDMEARRTSGEVIPFSKEQPEVTVGEVDPSLHDLANFLEQQKDQLTPAERQDMDASAPKPTNRNTGAEDVLGKGSVATTPVNDVPSSRDLELQKALDTPENKAEAQRVFEDTFSRELGEPLPDDYASAVIKQRGGTGRKFTKSAKEMNRVKDAADFAVHEFWQDKLDNLRGVDRNTPPARPPYPGEEGFPKPGEPGNSGGPKGGGDEPVDTRPALERLADAIKKAGPARERTEDMYHLERKSREAQIQAIRARGGSAGEIFGVLKGELPKADFESIADKFSPEDIRDIERHVITHKNLRGHEVAKVLTAVRGLFNPEGARIPTHSDLDLMNDVFPVQLTKALTAKVRKMEGGQLGLELLNTPKALASSVDVSAPGRQGMFLVGRKEFWDNLPEQFKFLASEDKYQAAMEAIKDHPNFELARQADLAVRDTSHLKIGDREEAFAANLPEELLEQLQEKMPGGKYIPNVYRASDRAYTGFLRKLRFDVFDTLIEKGRDQGINWEKNPKALKALGRYINSATGRGDLKSFGKSVESAAPYLNALFFSPRFMKSRIDLLNPLFYYNLHKASPFVAKEALKDGSKFLGTEALILGLAIAGGAEVEGDWRSSDSLKIKIGDTRIDTLTGFKPFLTLATRLVRRSTKTLSGEVKPIGMGTEGTGDFGERTGLDIFNDFKRTKAAPLPSAMMNWLDGKDSVGNKFKYTTEGARLIAPMWVPGLISVLQKDGAKGAWTVLPELIGWGTQTFNVEEQKAKRKADRQGQKDKKATPSNDAWETLPQYKGH